MILQVNLSCVLNAFCYVPTLDQSLIFWKILLAKQTVYSLQMLQQRPVKRITPQGIWN